MFFLFLAIFSSALLAIILKLSGSKSDNTYGVCLFNYMTASLIAFLFISDKNLLSTGGTVLGMGAVSGLLYLASLALYQININKNGTVLAAVFSKLGVIIPTAMGFIFFAEEPSLLQILGIVVAIADIVVINYRKGGSEGKSGGKVQAAGLLLLLLVGGLCDSTSKVFEFIGDRKDDDRFMFFIFFFAGILTLFPLIKSKKKIDLTTAVCGIVIGIPNYFVTRFLLKALTEIPSFIVYPSYSVGTIILISLMSRIFFKENLNKQEILGVGLILVALVMLNI